MRANFLLFHTYYKGSLSIDAIEKLLSHEQELKANVQNGFQVRLVSRPRRHSRRHSFREVRNVARLTIYHRSTEINFLLKFKSRN